ncbi:hypothetical protein EV189_1023 [Motilibacter rhizosphaerae]|uniref:Lipoprotein LpqN n=1 Tax=Motilibacter rhizosphaerae TaxID=598652 RepID=A0A4Q7NX02_9ACTN|nr:hypothetical protein [Motilibacter rhizosphaerae]RZS91775.1 hypothetical protein EV189_1023 [Motilibacter rhizosphaerae]
MRQPPLRALLLALAVALPVVTGCEHDGGTGARPAASTAPVPLTTPTSPPGTVRVVDAGHRYALVLPAGWRVVSDPTSPGAVEVSPTPVATSATPDPRTSAQAAYAFDQGASLVALKPSTGFAPNVTVMLKPAKGLAPADVAKVVPAATSGLRSLSASGVTTRTTTLSGLPAVQVDYTFTPAGSTAPVRGRQYYAICGETVVITTVSVASGAGTGAADFIAAHLRLGSG